MSGSETERILAKLAKDVEAAVHALYRGDVRQATARARTDGFVRDAASALRAVADPAPVAAPTSASPRPSVAAPVPAGASAGWTREEGEAVLKCITAWVPMGPPATTDPASKCVSATRELTPTWGQRELARAAIRKLSPP